MDEKKIKAYRKEYYKKNRESINAKNRLWHHKNRERLKEDKKKYYKKNRDRFLRYQKNYREQNEDVVKARKKEYRKKYRAKLKIRDRKYYLKNKERLNRQSKLRQDERMRNFFLKYKKGKSCEVCGYKEYPEILHFHHKNKEEKSFNISMIRRKDIPELDEEIRKCILLCPNCHMWLHYQETQERISREKTND